jgi:hypothetical protein
MEVEVSEIKKAMNLYFAFLKKRKFYLLVTFFVGLIIGITYAWVKKPKYEAQISFIINESDKGIGGSLLSLAGQSGLFLGGGGLTPNDDKILFLFSSRHILGEALLKSYESENGKMIIANKLIEELKMKSYWSSDSLMDGFEGIKEVRYDRLSRQENKALNVVIEVLLKGELIAFEALKKKSLVGQGTGIIFLKTTLPNELLAKSVAEEIYASIGNFYIENAIQKQQSNVDLLAGKMDSLQNLIHNKENLLGRESDNNFNIFKASGKVNELRLKRDLEILNAIMVEVIKNYEFAKITLEQQKPFFKLIDSPTLPLKSVYKSKLKFGFLAAFGLSFSLFFLFSVNYFRT